MVRALSISHFTQECHHYLLGRKFTVQTDHSSLTWVVWFHHLQGMLTCGLEELSQYKAEQAAEPPVPVAPSVPDGADDLQDQSASTINVGVDLPQAGADVAPAGWGLVIIQ